MNIEKLTALLNNNKYLVVGMENLHYCFKDDTLSIIGHEPNMVHYSLYEEKNNLFINTIPSLFGEDLRIEINDNDSFALFGKLSDKNYLILRKDIFG